jgi:hypothetical protein
MSKADIDKRLRSRRPPSLEEILALIIEVGEANGGGELAISLTKAVVAEALCGEKPIVLIRRIVSQVAERASGAWESLGRERLRRKFEELIREELIEYIEARGIDDLVTTSYEYLWRRLASLKINCILDLDESEVLERGDGKRLAAWVLYWHTYLSTSEVGKVFTMSQPGVVQALKGVTVLLVSHWYLTERLDGIPSDLHRGETCIRGLSIKKFKGDIMGGRLKQAVEAATRKGEREVAEAISYILE